MYVPTELIDIVYKYCNHMVLNQIKHRSLMHINYNIRNKHDKFKCRSLQKFGFRFLSSKRIRIEVILDECVCVMNTDVDKYYLDNSCCPVMKVKHNHTMDGCMNMYDLGIVDAIMEVVNSFYQMYKASGEFKYI